MAREEEGDDGWTEDDRKRSGGRNGVWREAEERNVGSKGRNKTAEKEEEEATGGDEICRGESESEAEEEEDDDDGDDDERTTWKTERSSSSAEAGGTTADQNSCRADWTERQKRCVDGVVVVVVVNGAPKKSWESNNVDTNIPAIPSNNEGDENIMTWTGVWGSRHTLGLLVFLGLTVSYMTRVGLSIAIVAMVGTRRHHRDSNTDDDGDERQHNLTDVCTPPPPLLHTQHSNHTHSLEEANFAWDEKTQGVVLGAFFYGYMANCFLGGRAAEYLGGRFVYGIGVVVPSFLTLFTSLSVHTSKELFIALRVLEGLGQALVYPALNSMLAAWLPPKERATFMACVLSGSMLGTMIAMSVGGWLCSSGILGGWPFMFYLFGGLGVAWGVPWYFLAHNHPEEHPGISKAELDYITAHRTYVKREKMMPLPIREIAASPSFWTLVVVSFGYHYTTFSLLTELPTYFKNIQHFQLSSNGVVSAVPFLTQWLVTIGWAVLVSVLSSRNLVSVVAVRKLSTGIGMYGSAAALVAMMGVGCNSTVAMTVLCVAVGCLGTVSSGALISEQDIAPNFAGSIKGLTNSVGSATGFLAPAITGAIINDNQTLTAWRTAFLLAAALSILCTTQYLFLSTDKVQPWNNPKPKSLTENTKWLESGGVGETDSTEPTVPWGGFSG